MRRTTLLPCAATSPTTNSFHLSAVLNIPGVCLTSCSAFRPHSTIFTTGTLALPVFAPCHRTVPPFAALLRYPFPLPLPYRTQRAGRDADYGAPYACAARNNACLRCRFTTDAPHPFPHLPTTTAPAPYLLNTCHAGLRRWTCRDAPALTLPAWRVFEPLTAARAPVCRGILPPVTDAAAYAPATYYRAYCYGTSLPRRFVSGRIYTPHAAHLPLPLLVRAGDLPATASRLRTFPYHRAVSAFLPAFRLPAAVSVIPGPYRYYPVQGLAGAATRAGTAVLRHPRARALWFYSTAYHCQVNPFRTRSRCTCAQNATCASTRGWRIARRCGSLADSTYHTCHSTPDLRDGRTGVLQTTAGSNSGAHGWFHTTTAPYADHAPDIPPHHHSTPPHHLQAGPPYVCSAATLCSNSSS